MTALERFLRYVTYDTQSSETSETTPSTPKQRLLGEALAQELQDHLADHADALVEAGWDPEEAQAHALAAMGEAQEVGRALNRAFPLRWLILSRVLLVLAVLAAIILGCLACDLLMTHDPTYLDLAGPVGAGGHRPPAPHPRPAGQRLEQPSGPG